MLANIKSAMKRIKVIAKKTARNKMIKSQLKTAVKKFEDALSLGDFNEAKAKFRHLEKKFMQAASKNVIHKNKAARKISRLSAKLKKII